MATKITISQYPDGRYCLDLADDDERTEALFEAHELQGGGFTWEGIVRSLIEMRMPRSLSQLSFGAEADNMYVYAANRALLEEVAALVQSAIDDQELMIAAIEHGGEAIE